MADSLKTLVDIFSYGQSAILDRELHRAISICLMQDDWTLAALSQHRLEVHHTAYGQREWFFDGILILVGRPLKGSLGLNYERFV